MNIVEIVNLWPPFEEGIETGVGWQGTVDTHLRRSASSTDAYLRRHLSSTMTTLRRGHNDPRRMSAGDTWLPRR